MFNFHNKIFHTLVLSFLICLIYACESNAPADYKLMNTYEMGNYATGFRSIFIRDSSRMIGKDEFRPVQIGFWYPSEPVPNRMTFRDYFLLSTEEMGPNDVNEDSVINHYKKLAERLGVQSGGIDSLFKTTFTSGRDAPLLGGNYPLVLVGQGNYQTAFHQVVLCEYLASHGFYVVTTPSPTRITGPFSDYEGLVEKATEQANDLKLARAKILEMLDKEDIRTGMVSYSFGARAALLYALDQPELQVLVSLDGGIGNKKGKEWITYVDDFNPDNVNIPILHFYQEGGKIVQPDFSLIKSLKGSPKEFVKIDSVNHAFFMIMGAADGAIPSFMDSPYPNAKMKNQRLLDETGQFLQRYLTEK